MINFSQVDPNDVLFGLVRTLLPDYLGPDCEKMCF